jgi:hypothetical protein
MLRIFKNLMSINMKYEAMQQPLKLEPRSRMQHQMETLMKQ